MGAWSQYIFACADYEFFLSWQNSSQKSVFDLRRLILHEFRRELSLVAVKALSACMLSKVSKLWDGHRQAAKRRGGPGPSRRMTEEWLYWKGIFVNSW